MRCIYMTQTIISISVVFIYGTVFHTVQGSSTTTVAVAVTTVSPCQPNIVQLTMSDDAINYCSGVKYVFKCPKLSTTYDWTFTMNSDIMSVKKFKSNLNVVEFCVQNLVGKVGTHRATLSITAKETSVQYDIPVVLEVEGILPSPAILNTTGTIPENAEPEQWRLELNLADPSKSDSITLILKNLPAQFEIQKLDSAFYIVLVDATALDIDKPWYPMTIQFPVEALDTDDSISTAWVTITVEDINDNPPNCSLTKQERVVNTSFRLGVDFDASEHCTDLDRDPRNRIQFYGLLSSGHCEGAFSINRPWGILTLHDSFNLVDRHCDLEILVGDPNFNTTLQLTVNIAGCPGQQEEGAGNWWPPGDPGETVFAQCHYPSTGLISRHCAENGVYLQPIARCTNIDIDELLRNVTESEMSAESMKKTLKTLSNLTSGQYGPLQEGDLLTSTSILTAVVNNNDANMSTSVLNSCLDVVNNLIMDKNTRAWQSLLATDGIGAESLFTVVDRYTEVASWTLNETTSDVQYAKDNLMLAFGNASSCTGDIQYPDRSSTAIPAWASTTRNTILLPCASAKHGSRYSTIFYRNLSAILPVRVGNESRQSNASVNAVVVAVTLYDSDSRVLPAPVEITFQMFNASYSQPVCSYWSSNAGKGSGSWSSDGCWVKQRDVKTVVCACSHLTSFAVLMSPGGATALPPIHQTVLTVISAVGCVVSMVSLLLTIVLHAVCWRFVKSDRAVILMHLCVALILAYSLFLGGVDKTNVKAVCTAIAALLHLLFLVVFFLMLAEGLHLAFSVLFVYLSLHRTYGRWLLLQAWGIPLLIVAICMGATQLKGYGSDESCWFSVGSGLIWAFIVPALLIIVVNAVIIVAVIRKLLSTAAIKSKSERQKTKAVVRSLCVLLPITGAGWVLGVFSVNDRTVGFQYAFAIVNSLQGLFIFIFHCILNKKIQEGFQHYRSRRRKDFGPGTTGDSQPSAPSTKTLAVDSSQPPKMVFRSQPLLTLRT